MSIATRTQLATVREIAGSYYVYWGDQPLCEKPECSQACAEQTAAWLNGLPASEFRVWVECAR
jgi:hypothetical protein